jgi:recombination protein RecT
METKMEKINKTALLRQELEKDGIKNRFNEMLGKKAAGFMSSIITVQNSNPQLKECEPMSIIGAAAVAATLDLPIDKNLGFAHIVPYGKVAQFQMGYKGFIQLAMRTGQYQTINACPIYDGEFISENRLTGEIVFDFNAKKSDTIIGFAAYFKMINGFEKTIYWTKEKITNHAKKYSKSFNNSSSRWQKDFNVMALKTVIKSLISKWGILSIDMQTAIITDQAVLKSTEIEDIEYIDGTTTDFEDVTETKAIETPKPKSKYNSEAEVQQDLLKGALTTDEAEKIIAELNKKAK